MAITTPILDLLLMDTYSPKTIAIGDSSVYPSGWNVSTPTIQITPPGYGTVTMPFVNGGIQVYNAFSLGLVINDAPECELGNLPDGVYTFKYSIAPAYTYNVTKQFLRTIQLQSDLDAAFLKLEMMECDGKLKRQKKMIIDDIEYYMAGAIACSNKCALKKATELYNKARKMLDNFIDNLDCNC